MEKSAGFYGPVGKRWMPQWYKRTWGDYTGNKMSLGFLTQDGVFYFHPFPCKIQDDIVFHAE